VNTNFRIPVALVFGAFLLAACASQQPGMPSHSGVVPPSWDAPSVRKGCGVQNGVKVRPCPVKLTSPSQKVIVAISGPHVVSGSYLGSCYDICRITLVRHGKPKKWLIVPGASCGKAGLLFQGLNRHDILVGNAGLEIINKSC
jgi:hypothetical protein